MTKAEQSLTDAFSALLHQLKNPLNRTDTKRLIDLLRLVPKLSNGPWAWACRAHFLKKEKSDHMNLIEQMASQASDDAAVMVRIAGWEATVLLLRFFNQSQKNDG